MSFKDSIKTYIEETKELDAQGIIVYAADKFQDKIKFASSLGEEDQIITDMIAKVTPQIEVFTLDSGRLFQETYDLIDKTQKQYSLKFKVYYPDTSKVEELVAAKGINCFYESTDNRKLCCHIRKVEPLKRALVGSNAWICGLRRAQSVTRTQVETFEWDKANEMIKVNPLAHWSLEDVSDYIKKNKIHVNPLHQQGFVSIGCAPCTRAINEGEDIRAGRWWWEAPEKRECGLHLNKDEK